MKVMSDKKRRLILLGCFIGFLSFVYVLDKNFSKKSMNYGFWVYKYEKLAGTFKKNTL